MTIFEKNKILKQIEYHDFNNTETLRIVTDFKYDRKGRLLSETQYKLYNEQSVKSYCIRSYKSGYLYKTEYEYPIRFMIKYHYNKSKDILSERVYVSHQSGKTFRNKKFRMIYKIYRGGRQSSMIGVKPAGEGGNR